MEKGLTSGVKILNGFLKLMVTCLVIILLSVPLAGIADWLNLIQ